MRSETVKTAIDHEEISKDSETTVYAEHLPMISKQYATMLDATLFNNHPHISNSKFSADWRATTTYVGMVVE